MRLGAETAAPALPEQFFGIGPAILHPMQNPGQASLTTKELGLKGNPRADIGLFFEIGYHPAR
jgi:hypothetical protein